MQRTTIMLPPDLKMQAQQLAQTRGVSLGDLIRQALANLLRSSQKGAGSADTDPLFADDAVWTGDVPGDLSQNHDSYLYGDEP